MQEQNMLLSFSYSFFMCVREQNHEWLFLLLIIIPYIQKQNALYIPTCKHLLYGDISLKALLTT